MKILNDLFGHLEGDELHNTSSESADNIIKRINLKCEEFNNYSDEIYYISISLGFATKINIEKTIKDV